MFVFNQMWGVTREECDWFYLISIILILNRIHSTDN